MVTPHTGMWSRYCFYETGRRLCLSETTSSVVYCQVTFSFLTSYHHVAMSTVTATGTITRNDTLSLLADYEIHRTPDTQIESGPPRVQPSESPVERIANPPQWPRDFHRVPAYRPVNRELDQSQRAVYQNRIEQAFVNVMLSGVWLNAVSVDLLNARIREFQC